MSHRDIALQVMWNRLISVVEEQALALVRTAFSTSVWSSCFSFLSSVMRWASRAGSPLSLSSLKAMPLR